MSDFANEPLLEFRRGYLRDSALAALAALDATLPITVPLVLDGDAVERAQIDSVDPADPRRVVSRGAASNTRDAAAAVASAADRHGAWAATPGAGRAATRSRAAGGLRGRRLELAALAVREAGKPWVEADADVCEAIDFLEYYAREAVALADGPSLLQLPGERNTMRFAPRGVVVVIAPWNFPFAIPTGMSAAALATGNAVVLKPAEQTPACAAAIAAALREAGLPEGVLTLLPGGDEPAKALVADPRVHTVAFTGSCAAGLAIAERAAKVAPGQDHLKNVVIEMGGKNCVIVDSDADLDDVVPAVLASAFAFAGQKCSAASRVLVHRDISGTLVSRLAGALDTLRVGPARDFSIDVPPVIDAAAQERIIGVVRAEIDRGATALRRAVPDDRGFYVAPTIFLEPAPQAGVVQEEIFGPVLTVETVNDADAACDVVDRCRFALTGGLFSRSPRTIERVIVRSPVGNLYVNRATTGAMVGRQPFGGNKLSGTGTKAGGPGYLMHFVEPRAVTENTVRHGLVIQQHF